MRMLGRFALGGPWGNKKDRQWGGDKRRRKRIEARATEREIEEEGWRQNWPYLYRMRMHRDRH